MVEKKIKCTSKIGLEIHISLKTEYKIFNKKNYLIIWTKKYFYLKVFYTIPSPALTESLVLVRFN